MKKQNFLKVLFLVCVVLSLYINCTSTEETETKQCRLTHVEMKKIEREVHQKLYNLIKTKYSLGCTTDDDCIIMPNWVCKRPYYCWGPAINKKHKEEYIQKKKEIDEECLPKFTGCTRSDLPRDFFTIPCPAVVPQKECRKAFSKGQCFY